MYESMFKIVYRSFIPSFSASYKALGSHETFFMKYTWELSVYFVFYVFPFVNRLLTQKHFMIPYFRRFSMLGPINRNLLTYISNYYSWRKQNLRPTEEPIFTDFTRSPMLAMAEKTFYRVGLEPPEAIGEIEKQLAGLKEYARYLMVHIDSMVLDDPDLLTNSAYIERLDITGQSFDPDAMKTARTAAGANTEPYHWSFCPNLLRSIFHTTDQREIVGETAE